MDLERYFSKNSGAVCYLICLKLLTLEEDIEVTRNRDGFVVVTFIPTDERMEAFRKYVGRRTYSRYSRVQQYIQQH